MSTFREQHRELQEIVRELQLVRHHNLKFKAEDPQHTMLQFAEGLLVLLCLERFLRIILCADATDKDTLPNLLEKATSQRRRLLTLPGTWTRDQSIKAITGVRNSIMHGNYEQAAAGNGHADPKAYFKSGNYISEVETLYQLTDELMKQIDVNTGKPHGHT